MAQCSTRRTPVLLIAETRPTLASGLKVFLSDFPDTQSVAIMAGFDHVVDYAEQHEIALIIVGEGMNSAAPLGELARLHKRNPSWRLVLLTDVADPDTVLAGLSAGASGVIPTSVGEAELHSAITRIRGGGIYFPDTRGFGDRQHRLSSTTAPTSRSVLTPRQLQVLGVLAEGNSNKQIAQILDISGSTVSMHLNAAFQALGVHDRTSAAMAYRNMGAAAHESRYDWAS